MAGAGKRKRHFGITGMISRNHGKRKVLDSRHSQWREK